MKKGSQHTYEILKKRIIAGHYLAGSQLKENHIATELGVSRTPVRAALKRLVEDGLAVGQASRGVFVASWTRWDIEEMFRLRIRLEPFAARLAAERADAVTVEKLKQCNNQMEMAIASLAKGNDAITEIQNANSLFHRLVLDAAGSQRLKSMMETMIDMPIITRSFFLYDTEDLARSLHHHRDLVLAIETGNEDLAEQVMSVHLQISSQRFLSQRLDTRQN